jgi:hypothetical protein
MNWGEVMNDPPRTYTINRVTEKEYMNKYTVDLYNVFKNFSYFLEN